MPFVKGQSGNYKGRPISSPTIKLRELIGGYLEDELPVFLEEVKRMKAGKVKSDTFISLMNFVIPKLSANDTKLDISKMSDEEAERCLRLIIDGAQPE